MELQKYMPFASARETVGVVAISGTNIGKKEEKPQLSTESFSCRLKAFPFLSDNSVTNVTAYDIYLSRLYRSKVSICC